MTLVTAVTAKVEMALLEPTFDFSVSVPVPALNVTGDAAKLVSRT